MSLPGKNVMSLIHYARRVFTKTTHYYNSLWEATEGKVIKNL